MIMPVVGRKCWAWWWYDINSSPTRVWSIISLSPPSEDPPSPQNTQYFSLNFSFGCYYQRQDVKKYWRCWKVLQIYNVSFHLLRPQFNISLGIDLDTLDETRLRQRGYRLCIYESVPRLMMTINDHQSLLNITVGPQRCLTETDQCFLFPVWQLTTPQSPWSPWWSPHCRMSPERRHRGQIPLIGARLATWPLTACHPLWPGPLVSGDGTQEAPDHRMCTRVSRGNKTTIPGHRETSTVDSLEGKQWMFRCQLCLPVLPSPRLSHIVPPSHTNLMLLRSSHCPGWLSAGLWLSLSPVPSLSRGAPSSVT